MENLSYIGLSQQMALHHLMEVTANNMANMSTPGYKSQDVLFKEYLNKTNDSEGKISQVQDVGTFRDLSQGPITHTGNKLDAAIDGEGYFAVQTAGGIRYTRGGSFSFNDKGEIVTQSGNTVLSSSNGPLAMQQGATRLTIMQNGEVSSEKGTIGKLKVVSFDDAQQLLPIGGGLYEATGAAEQPVARPHVIQGALEGSNVQPIVEMNRMIEVMRLYQSAQNMIMNDHDMQRSMIQKLTQT